MDRQVLNKTEFSSPPAATPRPDAAPVALIDETTRARNARQAGLMYTLAAAAAFLVELYLALQSQTWQAATIAALGGLLTLTAAWSVRLMRRGRIRFGLWLLIGASLFSVLAAPILIARIGLVLGLGMVLVMLALALQSLPAKEANIALLLSVLAALGGGLIDLAAPPSQLVLPLLRDALLILGSITFLIYLALTIRQYRDYPLTTKLILAFLAVSLIPLGLLAFFNTQHTRNLLLAQARLSLQTAVSQTAADVDAYIKAGLDAVNTEAQLPILAEYLRLPPEDRLSGAVPKAVAETLRELSRKDRVFIASYALLDRQGQNIIDTTAANIGQDESAYGYFQKPFETGLPYVSPVLFVPFLDEEAPDGMEEAALFFSSPIHDPETEEALGILRVRYRPIILQRLIVQHNYSTGDESFAILFDENQIRLAHGTAPETIFEPVVPLGAQRVAALRAAGRWPTRADTFPATHLPSLATGLDNAIFETYFVTRLRPTSDRLHLAAVKELESQPWLVVFAQPQEVFLTPIDTQIRNALFLVIAIAGAVVAVAFATGQFLAGPLVSLAETVSQFTAGDLDVRARLHSRDESGLLAGNFNLMAEQVGKLLRNLAERTHELESEVVERKRAQTSLQASERKYRALFEDSRDVIFITTPNGRIVDINPAGVALAGYSQAELLAMKVQDWYADPADRYRFQAAIEAHGGVKDFEVRLCLKDGRLMDGLVTATIRRSEDGRLLGYQGILRDITKQKQLEQERLRLTAIDQELRLARDNQQSLLPLAQPDWSGPETICYSNPAREVGGDFYAYHPFNERRFALAVGDVSGKGMPAALLMAVSLAAFQSGINHALPPAELLANLDRAIAPYTCRTGQNCALVYVEIFPQTGVSGERVVRAANAGCIAPLVRRSTGTVEWLDVRGTPLGVPLGEPADYPVVEVSLAAGDLLLLTSDGAIEAQNLDGEIFGFERFERTVLAGPVDSAEAMLQHLQRELLFFLEGAEPHDDLTLVVARL